ncbi:MAG: right-handed parallel beta-helix repeat-containing protein [Candidatus Eisenbacteria bacterium]|nr:right-handed parallel beta-helix repeat-containing protein [Candidatus Eisenbacteria bacterium]
MRRSVATAFTAAVIAVSGILPARAASDRPLRVRYGTDVDSLLVPPGTHVVSYQASAGRDLVIRGQGSAETCILVAEEGRGIIEGGRLGSGRLEISDVTLTGGAGSTGTDGALWGGAVYWGASGGPTATVQIQRCKFVENHIWGGPSQLGAYGGGVGLFNCGQVVIEQCTFENNSTDATGSHLYASVSRNIEVTGCTFEWDSGDIGARGLIVINGAMTTTLRECSVTTNAKPLGLLAGIAIGSQHTVLRRCSLRDLDGSIGTTLLIEADLLTEVYASVEMSDCEVWVGGGVSGGESGLVEIDAVNMDLTLLKNTIVGTDLVVNAGRVRNGTVSHNVCAYGRTGIGGRGRVALSCNVFWPAPPRVTADLDSMDNRVADPQFCGVEQGDLTVRSGGPCAIEGSPCGIIGALGVGCAQTAVLRSTWGAIKARFLPPSRE